MPDFQISTEEDKRPIPVDFCDPEGFSIATRIKNVSNEQGVGEAYSVEDPSKRSTIVNKRVDLDPGEEERVVFNYPPQDPIENQKLVPIGARGKGTEDADSLVIPSIAHNPQRRITVENIDWPSELSPGETVEVNVVFSSSSRCRNEVKAKLSTDISDDKVKEVILDPMGTANVTFTVEVPSSIPQNVEFNLSVFRRYPDFSTEGNKKTTPYASAEYKLYKELSKVIPRDLPPNFNLENISAPANVCPGQTFELSAKVSNTGRGSGAAKLELKNKQSSETVEFGDFKLQSGKSVNKSVTVGPFSPDQTIPLEVTLSSTSEGRVKKVASDTRSIEVGNPLLQIESIKGKPTSKVCGDQSIPITVQVGSTSRCPVRGEVEISSQSLDAITSKSVDVSGDQSAEKEFLIPIPADPPSEISIQTSVRTDVGDVKEVTDSKISTIQTQTPRATITGVRSPEQECQGGAPDIEVNLSKVNQCNTAGLIKVRNNKTGEVRQTKEIQVSNNTSKIVQAPKLGVKSGEVSYTVELITTTPNNAVTDTDKFTVNVKQPKAVIEDIQSPDSLCVDSKPPVDIQLGNVNECETNAFIRVKNQRTSEVTETDNITVTPGTSRTVETPNIGSKSGDVGYTVEVVTTTQFGTRVTDAKEFNIGAIEPSVSISNIETPESVCKGKTVPVNITLTRDNRCETEGRFKLTNQATGNVKESQPTTVSGTATQRTEVSIPEIESNKATLSIEAITVNDNGTVTDTQNVSINLNEPNISLNTVNGPDQACASKQVSFDVSVSNTGACKEIINVKMSNQLTGDVTELGETELSPNSSLKPKFNPVIPEKVDDSITYKFTVTREVNGETVTVDTVNETVNIGSPTFEVENIEAPKFAQPGSTITTSFDVVNEGDCQGNVAVQLEKTTGTTTNQITSKDLQLSSGQGSSLNVQTDMEPATVNVSVTVINRESGSAQSSSSVTIRPHKYVNLNTKAGRLTVVGGFDDSVDYEGTIQARSVSGEELDEKDEVLGGVLVGAKFIGKASSDSSDTDEVTFSNINYLNMSVDEEIQWVVDGSIKGVSSSFSYRSVSRNIATRPKNLPSESPSIQVTYGPLNRLNNISGVFPR